MLLENRINELFDALENSGEFENSIIIRAYPDVRKPTRLTKSVIALCPSEIDVKMLSLTGEGYSGEYSVEAWIHVPQRRGKGELFSIAEKVVVTAAELEPLKIFVSKIEAEDALESYVIRCVFTFFGMIEGE